MTTFYLGGGYNERSPDVEYHKLLAGYANKKVLYLGFANPDLKRRREKMEELFENASKYTLAKISYDISSESTDLLSQELSIHDVWVIGGGIARYYVDVFGQIPNVLKLLKEKVIFGSSAGAVMWGHHYYETDEDKFARGLGILPYNMLVHFDDTKKGLDEKLKVDYPNYPVLELPEYQHQIFKV
jgi:peptidase E